MFERTWDVAVKLCRNGRVDGRHFSVGVGLMAAEGSKADTAQRPRWAIMSPDGKAVFAAPGEEEAEAGALFTVARRFVELEDAHQRGTSVPDYALEARRTYRDSLREWGLMDEGGPLLGQEQLALDIDGKVRVGLNQPDYGLHGDGARDLFVHERQPIRCSEYDASHRSNHDFRILKSRRGGGRELFSPRQSCSMFVSTHLYMSIGI